jgi:hypothetical protein
MKTLATALALTFTLGASTLACSSESSGGRVDTGTALSSLRSPTGTFDKSNATSAFAGFRDQRERSSNVAGAQPAGRAQTGSSQQGLRILNTAASLEANCSEGQTCACPGSGSASWSHESTAEGEVVRMSFAQCVFEDGDAFDGEAVVLASKEPLLGLERETGGAFGDTGDLGGYASLLIAANGDMTHQGKTMALQFALLMEAGYTLLSVEVPDGSVVIGIAPSGKVIVMAKNETWTCAATAGAYACTSSSGEQLDVEAALSAGDDGDDDGGEISEGDEGDDPFDGWSDDE